LNRHGIKAERQNGCKGINAMVELNQLAFTAQPIPVLARVDLAAIFLHRQSLLDTNLLFGKRSRRVSYLLWARCSLCGRGAPDVGGVLLMWEGCS
jgi:hypothetical protein